MEQYTNELINESSPYLLQHAHNPVNWVPWSRDVFEQAQSEDKLVLISVGYSSCHWCHVMEHESFEDEEVAAIMNKFFVCIKVDREERPDVDNIYMKAVQLMTHRGGWPLNCFTLPDGKPIYGGTYFPKEQWMYILKSLQNTYVKDPQRIIDYANDLTEGIIKSEVIQQAPIHLLDSNDPFVNISAPWSRILDNSNGGFGGAPKFPTPVNLNLLKEFSIYSEKEAFENHYLLTLDKMALGGIYDQIGGGFARYSVDAEWKVPHFEKMLYDNAQLIGTYSIAFRSSKNTMYRRIVKETLSWLTDEMKAADHSFYAAIDADSEGVEGKFYVWQKEELTEIRDVADIYDMDQSYWEGGNYVLMRSKSDQEVMIEHALNENEFYSKLNKINGELSNVRSERIRPGLDDKRITSWNALLLSGMCEAYRSFNDAETLKDAGELAKWIQNQSNSEGEIYRINGDSKKIKGFIEDYAFAIEAFIDYYQITFSAEHLLKAKNWMEFAISNFCDGFGKMFKTSSERDLISDSYELQDSVIPSPNSVMAWNLLRLGKYFNIPQWEDHAKQMLANVYSDIPNYVSAYANWSRLAIYLHNGCPELKIYRAIEQIPDPKLLSEIDRTILIINGDDHALSLNTTYSSYDALTYLYCDRNGCRLPATEAQALLKLIN